MTNVSPADAFPKISVTLVLTATVFPDPAAIVAPPATKSTP